MKKFFFTPKTLAIALAGSFFGSTFSFPPEASAAGFIDDSTLGGGVYYWQRKRDRKDITDGNYKPNLSHATTNISLDFSSGFAADTIGLDLGVFTAIELYEADDSGHPNEIAFSRAGKGYDEDYGGDKSGVSLYKAAVKLKRGNYWLRAGYIQPSGQTLLAPHWSLMPGTYQGAETGTSVDFGDQGALSFSYMWANKYKAPWNNRMDDLRQGRGIGERTSKKDVSYVHSLGGKYDFKNNLVLEAAVGQSQGYVNQFLIKPSYKFNVAGNPLTTSYQFYGAKDRTDKNDPDSIYDGLAWLQALTFGYTTGPVDWRFEGTMVKADGNMGYFLHRMTPAYASSNGRLDIWWNNRSDFNANGEKAIFAGLMYKLGAWNLPGAAIGGSYVYGWGAKPSSTAAVDQSQRVKESAISLDAVYTIQEGRGKGTKFQLHLTKYNNHSDNPSWSNGYNNMFQDEKDLKFIVSMPFSVF